jgi:hypothetical protein
MVINLLKMEFVYRSVNTFHHEGHEEHKGQKEDNVSKGFLTRSYYVILCVLRELRGFITFFCLGRLKRIGTQLEFNE